MYFYFTLLVLSKNTWPHVWLEYDIELYSNIHHICSIDNMHVKVIIPLRHYFPMRRKQNNDTTLYG